MLPDNSCFTMFLSKYNNVDNDDSSAVFKVQLSHPCIATEKNYRAFHNLIVVLMLTLWLMHHSSERIDTLAFSWWPKRWQQNVADVWAILGNSQGINSYLKNCGQVTMLTLVKTIRLWKAVGLYSFLSQNISVRIGPWKRRMNFWCEMCMVNSKGFSTEANKWVAIGQIWKRDFLLSVLKKEVIFRWSYRHEDVAMLVGSHSRNKVGQRKEDDQEPLAWAAVWNALD